MQCRGRRRVLGQVDALIFVEFRVISALVFLLIVPAALRGCMLSVLYFEQCNAALVARGARVRSRPLARSRVLGLAPLLSGSRSRALSFMALFLGPWALSPS